MLVSGKIIILVDDKPDSSNRIQYGFVKVKGMEEEVFFNILSSFQNTSFENLKIGDSVRVLVKQTDRGPFAENLILSRQQPQKEISPPSEVGL